MNSVQGIFHYSLGLGFMIDREKLQNPIFLFPLPSTVFYPSTLLPLHVFEPRYRQMVIDALESHRLIGMVLLRPGWEENYFDKPVVATVGCAGKIETTQSLPDGKFNIILKGLSRFRIVREAGSKPYRLAEVDFLSEVNDESVDFSENLYAKKLFDYYEKYMDLLPAEHQSKKIELKNCQWLSSMVDQIAYQFDFKSEDKQTLLEELDVRKRVETLMSMVELKIRIINISKSYGKKGVDTRMN